MRWIVTDDIYAETWRQLLEFANFDLTKDVIARRHGEPKSKKDHHNFTKQASQARVCVLQAKEYFDAARETTLFTSPNHSYYGANALASLIMLVLGDGTMSLDYLRSDNKNKHHGLGFSTGCNAKSASSGLELVENSRVEILGFGHFFNLYKSLPAKGPVFATAKRIHGSTFTTNMQTVGEYKVPTIDTLVNTQKTLLELLKFLPDLNSELQRFGITVNQSRSTHEVQYKDDVEHTHTWRIHECKTENELEKILEKFVVCARLSDALDFQGSENARSGIVKLQFKPLQDYAFSWPNSRNTMNHDTISYADMPETHEITDLYLVAYQLSMLSRYFPDIWVGCIESQCRAAKLIERATDVIIKKLPILTLSILCNQEIVISTHREPWKE